MVIVFTMCVVLVATGVIMVMAGVAREGAVWKKVWITGAALVVLAIVAAFISMRA